MTDRKPLAGLALCAFGLAACDVDTADTATTSSSPTSGQEQACLAAVANETNEGNVSVLSSAFSEADTVVMVGVGDDAAPWRCLVSDDGRVEEVYFAGTEGFL